MIVISAEAVGDLKEAYRHYEGESPGLGEKFLGAVGDAFDRIEQFLELYATVRGDTRCAVLR